MISALVLVTAIVVALSPGPVIGALTSGLQAILMNTHGSKEYDYPTDLTRDIYPVSYGCLGRNCWLLLSFATGPAAQVEHG